MGHLEVGIRAGLDRDSSGDNGWTLRLRCVTVNDKVNFVSSTSIGARDRFATRGGHACGGKRLPLAPERVLGKDNGLARNASTKEMTTMRNQLAAAIAFVCLTGTAAAQPPPACPLRNAEPDLCDGRHGNRRQSPRR